MVILALAVFVSAFIYSEYKAYIQNASENSLDQKFIETGMLINLVYETDGFSRIALLTEKEEDFIKYTTKVDSLYNQIENIKKLTSSAFQLKQLDSVKSLLEEKTRNIEQLRVLTITSNKDSSLDDILDEIKKLEETMGKNSLETMIKNPSILSKKERKVWQSYVDWLNASTLTDTTKLNTKMVDSMLVASRFIVSEAKKENSRIRQSLQQKENELIRNDLTISEQLRQIIAALDFEISKNNNLEKEHRLASIQRTSYTLKLASIAAALIMLLFTYLILTDFFKAEKFKTNLAEAKQYSEDLLKSREQLISTVSHDLKTPLNTILGYTELIEDTPLSEKQQHYSSQISTSATFISKLVNDLLDFSKLEAGKLTIDAIPFSLENCINDIAKASEDMYAQKNVSLLVSISETVQNTFYIGDPLRIQQIIHNLVGNAFKFTEEGTIEISVTEHKQTAETAVLQISVKDTGIGISKEKQQLIFKEFTQAEEDTAPKYGGYGLGLAISKKLSQLLNGSLTVTSKLEEGSTFTLELPLKKSNRIIPKKQVSKQQGFSKIKGLILDDDATMLELLGEVLALLNVETELYTTFTELQKRATSDFDFILTDIQMPDMDGFTVLKKIQQGTLSAYSQQPIIAMTGNRAIEKKVYLEKGFSNMLLKPFSKDQLAKLLSELFPSKIEIKAENSEILQSPKHANEEYSLALLSSFVGDKAALKEILSEYLNQTKKNRIELEEAFQTKDFETINSIAHKMLTMKRQIEAKHILPILERLEKATSETISDSELKTLSETLKKHLNNLVTGLEKEIS